MATLAAKRGRKGRRAHAAKCAYCNTRHGDGAPWWNASKNGWAITYKENGKPRNRLLAKGWEGHDEAIREWKAMTAGQIAATPLENLSTGEDTTIETLVHHRLDYLKNNASAGSYKNAKGWLSDFALHPRFGFGKTTIREMRSGGIARIKQWVAAHQWNDSTKESVYKTVKALFNYATDRSEDGLGIIESSPIAKLNTGRQRVRGKSRVGVFSADQEAAILRNADPRGIYPQFAIAFRVLLATGVRPEEFCSLTAADVRRDSNGQAYWWVRHKNIRKTGSKRRVYLTPEAQKITAEQVAKYPAGPIFRNSWDQPWDRDGLYQAFRRVTSRKECVALGLDDHEVGKRTDGKKKNEYVFVIYTCRHTFAHRHLTGFYKRADGTPIVLSYGEVAELMGNTAAEVERTYGKLEKATTYLSKLIEHN
jgi:integrase